MHRFFLVVLIGLITLPGLAQSSWQVRSGNISFEIKNAGFTVDGSFGDLKGDIRFHPSEVAQAQLSASVGVETIETGITSRDHHLMGQEYFYVDQYPRIKMRAVRITKRSATAFDGKFELTIRGKTQLIDFPFTFRHDGETGSFDGEFLINRLDFGVGGNSLFLSNDVKVSLHVDVVAASGPSPGGTP
jgi:polyisoprenoid-binding protein YceI